MSDPHWSGHPAIAKALDATSAESPSAHDPARELAEGEPGAHQALSERFEAYLLNRKFDGRRLSVTYAHELASHLATVALDYLCAFLAEREREWAERAEASHVLQVRAEGRVASLRAALEGLLDAYLVACGIRTEDLEAGVDSRDGHPVDPRALTAHAALASGAGRREAEVLRAADRLEGHVSSLEADQARLDKLGEDELFVREFRDLLRTVRAARGGEGEG